MVCAAAYELGTYLLLYFDASVGGWLDVSGGTWGGVFCVCGWSPWSPCYLFLVTLFCPLVYLRPGVVQRTTSYCLPGTGPWDCHLYLHGSTVGYTSSMRGGNDRAVLKLSAEHVLFHPRYW